MSKKLELSISVLAEKAKLYNSVSEKIDVEKI